MQICRNVTLVAALLLLPVLSHADFKYTQQSQITGGMLVSMTKTLGVFSKNMRQMNEPQLSTTMVKGNRLRSEHATGEVQIIDLGGRRFIYLDPAKKTYSVVTFDDFKAALQRAQERAREEQAKQAGTHPEAQNVTMTPKFDAQVTGASREILGLTANEMKIKMEMEFQSDDPKAKQQMQSASMIYNSDAWMAPSVPGYDELHSFYLKMAKELDWLPSTMMGGMGSMKMANPQMGSGMDEFRKNALNVKGMPMLQTLSITMAGSGASPQGQGTQASPTQPSTQPQPPPSQDSSIPTNTKDAVGKALGGMFGHKKKQDQQPSTPPDATGTSAPPAGSSNSLMDMTVQVTSFSNDSLDSSLFDVPAGYTQVQRNPDDAFSGKHP